MFQPNKKYVSPRTKKRNQSKQVNKLLQKGIIPLGINKNYLLQQVKYSLSQSEVDLILETTDDETFYFLIGNPIAKSYSELSNYAEYSFQFDIEKELIWIERFILDYSEEINSFLRLEIYVENTLLLGRYNEADKLLDQIDDEISKSIWGVQKRLLLAEFRGGFQENKQVLASVLEEAPGALVASISNYTSIRVEKNISISQYSEILNDYISKLAEELRSYFYTKVNFFWNHDQKCAGILMALDGTMSIIDRYKAFILAAQLILTSDLYSEKVKRRLIRIVHDLRLVINDVDLVNLDCLQSGLHKCDETPDFQKLLDFYTKGEYGQALELSIELISKNTQSYPLLYIYCHTLCFLKREHVNTIGEKGSVIEKVIKWFISILQKDEFYEESISAMYVQVQALGCHPLAIGLYNFLIEQLPFKIFPVNRINFEKLSLLNSKYINPSLYYFIATEKKDIFLSCFVENSPIINLIKLIHNEECPIVDFQLLSLRELKYLALFFLSLNKCQEALSVFDYILNNDRFEDEIRLKLVKAEIVSYKFRCLVSLKKNTQALEFLVDTLIDEPNFQNIFYNPDFIESLVNSTDIDLSNNICLPIFLKIYELDVDEYQLYVAYDNFLCSLGCETPKDFFNFFQNENKRHITFLEKVCRHEVLYSSPFFTDQEELDLARIEVCNFLASRAQNINNLEAEVSELLRKVVVRKGIKQIDYSKIYVDINAIKNTVTKELRENFLRNVEIASLPLDQLNKLKGAVDTVFVYYVDADVEMKEIEEEVLNKEDILQTVKLTSYDRFIHYKEAFFKIRDLFLFSSDNGLDTYLSMRIRHGTLPGQLRSVFEVQKLITSWSELDQQYLVNDYLLDKYSLNEDDRIGFNIALNNFSSGVDTISEKLKAQTIQISTESKPSNGLFNYNYSNDQLLSLFQIKLGSIKDFNFFVDAVIKELWERTEVCLDSIRTCLNGEITEKYNKLFDSLEASMNEFPALTYVYNENAHQELITRLRNSRTAIGVELQKISEWFRRSNKKYLQSFDFSILLDSSMQALVRSFLGTTININNNCKLQIDGDFFPHFTDIIFYLLHNALKHSKLSANSLEVLITVTNDADRIFIEVRNTIINDPAYIEYCKEKIKNVTQMLDDMTKVQKAFSKEGGTGFPKIKKSLVQNLSRVYSEIKLNIEMYKEPWFVATISFEFNGLLKQETNENFNN